MDPPLDGNPLHAVETVERHHGLALPDHRGHFRIHGSCLPPRRSALPLEQAVMDPARRDPCLLVPMQVLAHGPSRDQGRHYRGYEVNRRLVLLCS